MKVWRGGMVLLLLIISSSAYSFDLVQNEAPPQLVRLGEQLELYRKIAAQNHWRQLPDGLCLQSGDTGAWVLVLRQNLLLTHDLKTTSHDTPGAIFDEQLKEGVRNFQFRHGLLPDGIVGQHTLEEMRVSPAKRLQQITLNLERWQAFYSHEAQPNVFVNIPDYTLQLLDKDYKTVWQTRVIVGLAAKGYQTVQMEGHISHLIINPTWTVPKSIIRREIIPIMKRDPGYLARNHMKLYRHSRTARNRMGANAINWQKAGSDLDNITIVQDAGPWNALGKVKFIFPNPYSIYLHDTPTKPLFSQLTRAYSHGCVRVQHPEKLASYLLSDDWQKPQDVSAYFKLTIPEKHVPLPAPVLIRIGYFTSWVDDAGVLQFRKDIYLKDIFPNKPVAEGVL